MVKSMACWGGDAFLVYLRQHAVMMAPAAEVQFSLVLGPNFPNAKPNHRFGLSVWLNPGPNITERIWEVRFAFEPGLTKLADDGPELHHKCHAQTPSAHQQLLTWLRRVRTTDESRRREEDEEILRRCWDGALGDFSQGLDINLW
ncbi:hypothetical protein BDR06DRAFT_971656 [Suillus hirtellus]|nr:hypothetical protein BDR06DRAFT_971656 [Suillus hirtellus]